VEDVLSGKSEADKVLYDDSDFVLLPDMKWDLKTLSALYLVAIVRDRTVKSLRDLRKVHLKVLKKIQTEAWRVVREKWAVKHGGVVLFVHYQPSYCECSDFSEGDILIQLVDHFHVHIVNVNHYGHMGMRVGQAHLLDDVISLVSFPSYCPDRSLCLIA
jgi:m7GpppX diphosphatase